MEGVPAPEIESAKKILRGLRDRIARSVFLAMSARFNVLVAAAGLLVAGATQAHGQAPAELPGGDSPAFRSRMTAWSEPAPARRTENPIVETRPVTHAARLPRLTSRFGYRTDPLRGGQRMHTGIDIPGPLGSAVRASASGRVRFAGRAGGYGEMVELDHGGGLSTRYAHLSRILVSGGERIGAGDVIGLMGSTGRSTGSHLHFEVRVAGRPLDPLGYLAGGAQAVSQRVYALGPMDSRKPHVSEFARRRAEAAGTVAQSR